MDYRDKIEAARLANAPLAEAIAWLEENATKEIPRWDARANARHIIEYLLFRRQDAAVNLALARFATYAPVLRKLYNDGSKVLQLAVLTNPFVGPETVHRRRSTMVLTNQDVVHMMRAFPATRNHLNAYFRNRCIPRELVEDVLNRKAPFDFIDDSLLCYLVSCLAENTIITEPRDDTRLNGFSEYIYNRLFFALLNLVGTAPTTQYWADILTPIVQRVHMPFLPSEITFDVINRWKIEDVSDGDPQLSPSFWLRHAIAIRFLRDGHGANARAVTPDNEDKAVRLAYFAVCKPEDIFGHFVRDDGFRYPNFKYLVEEETNLTEDQIRVVDACTTYFHLDRNQFIEELIRNKNFWRRKQEREF